MRIHWSLASAALVVLATALPAGQSPSGQRRAAAPAAGPAPIDVTVSEGTSMSVAVSPDGARSRSTCRAASGRCRPPAAPRSRITDVFNDARQPVWSPDGKTIAFFGYRDGGYDIWAVAPDGTDQRKLTWGPFDDREPAGRTTARASPSRRTAAIRSAATTTSGSSTLRSGGAAAGHDATRPTTSCRPGRPTTGRSRSRRRARRRTGVWAAPVGRRRRSGKVADAHAAASTRPRGDRAGRSCITRVQGQRAGSRWTASRSPATRTCFPFRARWASRDRVLLRVGRQDPRRAIAGRRGRRRSIHRHAAGEPGRGTRRAQARLRLHGAAPGARHRAARDLAGRHPGRVCRARRHLRDADRRQAREPHEGPLPRHRSGVVARRHPARRTRPTRAAICSSSGSAT